MRLEKDSQRPAVGGHLPLHPGLCDRGAAAGLYGGQRCYGDSLLEYQQAIYESCGENAAYGKQVLQYISERMTEEFEKGFNIRNLRYMRQFYLTFPNVNALRSELSWTHYRSLMKVNDAKVRAFYLTEYENWRIRRNRACEAIGPIIDNFVG